MDTQLHWRRKLPTPNVVVFMDDRRVPMINDSDWIIASRRSSTKYDA